MNDIRVDEKGKFYTAHISKRTTPVIAATATTILRGAMHLMLDNRLKDELNGAEPFIAITDARVYALDGETLLYNAAVVMINKSQILWIIPQEDHHGTSKSDRH